jgi:hypothetical protein
MEQANLQAAIPRLAFARSKPQHAKASAYIGSKNERYSPKAKVTRSNRVDFRLRDDVGGGRPRLATAIAVSPPAWVRSILITECDNGEARKPMLAHVVAGNMGKTYGQMIFGGF